MKIKLLIIICSILAVNILHAEMFDVKIGDDINKIENVLGKPDSYILIGKRAVLTYPRGKIILVSNKVVEVNFISEEKAAELKKQQEVASIKAKDARKRQNEYLAKKGLALKQSKLEDVDFLSLPLKEQFNYWKKFKQRYPMVDLAPVDLVEMAAKIAENAEEQRKKQDERLEQELLEAKWKLMDAEERARKAELEASRNHGRTYYSYGSYIWPPQVVIPGGNYPCRPKPKPPCGPSILPVNKPKPIKQGAGIKNPVAPHASRWPSFTPGVFPNNAK